MVVVRNSCNDAIGIYDVIWEIFREPVGFLLLRCLVSDRKVSFQFGSLEKCV